MHLEIACRKWRCDPRLDPRLQAVGSGDATPGFDPVFSGGPLGIKIDPTNTYLYAPIFPASVAICRINPNGTLQPCTLQNGNGTFNFTDNNSINMTIQNINGASYAYLPNGGSSSPATVSVCPIQGDGAFGTCTAFPSSTFNTPDGITIATLGVY